MAKHSKYANIKHRKAAQDAQKGKIYCLHAKLIALAAQSNPDPKQNPTLAMIVEKAKKDGVPNENIERAIKKGSGEDKSGDKISEITYEGYAPGGVAILVNVLTDNKNRTASNIRHIFTKLGGNLGEPGAVSWMFKRKGVIIVDAEKYNYDTVEELVLETNALDIFKEDNTIEILTSTEELETVHTFLKAKKIDTLHAECEYIAENKIEINDFDKALKFKKMMEAFDEDEDVNSVASNEIISGELEKEVEDFIEKNTFRT